MTRAIISFLVAAAAVFGQAPDAPPHFEIADVHASPKNGRQTYSTKASATVYEVLNSTMLNLIRIAWGGFPPDRILGGPNWLEQDLFDVIGKYPANTTAEARRLMLRPLLEERFQLKVHPETRPLPAWELTQGRKVLLKRADGTGETGCKPQAGSNGVISLGPGGTLTYVCRNTSMEAFARNLVGMVGQGTQRSVSSNGILDHTSLEGLWNFEYSWSAVRGGFVPDEGERVSIFDALEKQLGLRLEKIQVPTEVLVVDAVNRKPAANPPGAAEAFPTIPIPTAFEVADVKPSGPERRPGRFMMPVGGRFESGRPMSALIRDAFNIHQSGGIAGIPPWAETASFDIAAKAPTNGLPASRLDNESLAPMLLGLLKERFGLKYHREDRAVSAYSLVAPKPKLKKADPASRTWCQLEMSPLDAPPGSRRLTCQNATMAEFAENLRGAVPELGWPVLDATSLAGGWDINLTYLWNPQMTMAMARGGDPQEARDPIKGLTIFEAIEKLGLKLEAKKRTESVVVIDHLEQTPTEN